MRLAQSDTAIEEQWIECDVTAFSHPPGRRVRQFIGLAHNECVKGESRVKRCAWHVAVVCTVGFRFRRRGLPFDRSGLSRDRKPDTRNVLTGGGKLLQNLVAKVSRHPVSHELSRNQKRCHAFVEAREFQRLDPVHIIILAHRLEKLASDPSPCFIRHVPSTRHARFCYQDWHAKPAPGPSIRYWPAPVSLWIQVALESLQLPSDTPRGIARVIRNDLAMTLAARRDRTPDRQRSRSLGGMLSPSASITSAARSGLTDMSGNACPFNA